MGDPYETFWNFFETHSSDFLRKSSADVAEKLTDELASLGVPVSVEVSATKAIKVGEQRELVFTADGQRRFFFHIKELLRQKPVVRSWKITGLKSAKGFRFQYLDSSGVAKPASWSFTPLRNPSGQLGLRIGLPPNHPEVSSTQLMRVISTGIGEEAASQVVFLDSVHPAAGDQGTYLPIDMLGEYVRWQAAADGVPLSDNPSL